MNKVKLMLRTDQDNVWLSCWVLFVAGVAANHLPAMTFIPTFTATAWYHHMLSDDLQAMTLEEAVAVRLLFKHICP